MLTYILKRLLLMVPTLLGALTITFVVIQFVPGGPVEQIMAEARAGGGAKAQARHREQNKLFVRDRIDKVLDPGSPFLEIGALAAHGMYDGAAPCAGVVTGIGRRVEHGPVHAEVVEEAVAELVGIEAAASRRQRRAEGRSGERGRG